MIRKHIDYSDLNFYEIDIVEENKYGLDCGFLEGKECAFKLIDIYKYFIKVSNSYYKNKNDIDKIYEDIVSQFGNPLKKNKEEYKSIVKKQLIYIHSIITEKSIDSQLAKINKVNSKFKIFFKLIESNTYITDYKVLPCAQFPFSLWLYCYSLICTIQNKQDNIFICNECGKIDRKNANNQRFCSQCNDKISFSKITHRYKGM